MHAFPSETDTEKDPRPAMVMEVVAMDVMAMEVMATESEPDERPEDEATMEVTPAVPVAMMPKAATVDLLDQRGGLCLERHAADWRRHRGNRHHPEPERASNDGSE
jgi:hypothetical protein